MAKDFQIPAFNGEAVDLTTGRKAAQARDARTADPHPRPPRWYNAVYLFIGALFGIILIKSEIVSWFRIQEMFRLQSFHLYGMAASAVAVGAISVWLIKRFRIKTIYGEAIEFHPKRFNKGNIIGGLLFGLGWAMEGACPGSMFALTGTGASVIGVALASALAGTWVYGYFRERLPH